MKVSKHLATVGVLVLASGATYVGVRIYKHVQFPKWHASIVLGDSEEIVRAKMGSPDSVNIAPAALWCAKTGIVREFMYGHPIPPEWWVVGFDREGRVRCTTYLVSP